MLRISLAALLTAASLCGQTTFAAIAGSVSGPAGGFVSGASVAAVHRAGNYRFTARSIETGNYTIRRCGKARTRFESRPPGSVSS